MLAVVFACPVRILDLNNAGKLGAGPGFILMKKEKNPPFVNFFYFFTSEDSRSREGQRHRWNFFLCKT